jgi:hypothetical protein
VLSIEHSANACHTERHRPEINKAPALGKSTSFFEDVQCTFSLREEKEIQRSLNRN